MGAKPTLIINNTLPIITKVVTLNQCNLYSEYHVLSRLIEADYNSGTEIFTYGFDLAGNLTNLNSASRTYNAANQLVNDGTNNLAYDANGNMTSDGVNSYVWDHANRLLSMGGVSYTYNGDGNRIQQDALKYILDLQPKLAQVIGDSDGNRYLYGPRGLHAVNDGSDWAYPLTDALGSVRGYVGMNNAVLSTTNYSEFGVPDTNIVGPAFTGEWRSGNETQYHRARHLSPGLATWLSLDPFEGTTDRPMSMNGYLYVEGNVPNFSDPSGLCFVPFLPLLLQNLPNLNAPCDMRDNDNGVNVLLWTAVRETSPNFNDSANNPTIRASEHAKAALMIMQINAYQFPDPQTGVTGRWRTIGSNNSLEIWRSVQPIPSNPQTGTEGTTQRERTLAGLLVNGYCTSTDHNPLAFFVTSDPFIREAVTDVYPEVTENLYDSEHNTQGLIWLSQHHDLSFEVSFSAERVDWVKTWLNGAHPWQRGGPISAMIEPSFPYIVSGGTKAILIGNSATSGLTLYAQCPLNQLPFVRENPGTVRQRGQVLTSPGNHYTCTPDSNRTTWCWWWQKAGTNPDDSSSWELVTNSQYNDGRAQNGFPAYVRANTEEACSG